MPETNRTLAYAGESIPFHLSYSKRKTLEIAVHPDCSVVVKAPLGEDETLIEDFINKRASWIKRQIRYSRSLHRAPPSGSLSAAKAIFTSANSIG